VKSESTGRQFTGDPTGDVVDVKGGEGESIQKHPTSGPDTEVIDTMLVPAKEAIADPVISATLDAIPETVVDMLAGQMGRNQDPWNLTATTASTPNRDGGMAHPLS